MVVRQPTHEQFIPFVCVLSFRKCSMAMNDLNDSPFYLTSASEWKECMFDGNLCDFFEDFGKNSISLTTFQQGSTALSFCCYCYICAYEVEMSFEEILCSVHILLIYIILVTDVNM